MTATDERAAVQAFLRRDSFAERDARSRAHALLDEPGTELLGPFDRIESPWLEQQGVVPQSDDGVVVVRGAIGGRAVVVIGIEQAFQGGGIGEVSGAKITAALHHAAEDTRAGRPTAAVLLLETGGVRLQEANLGLAAIAEACAAAIELRELQPVIGVVAGALGSFGGMSIVAGLCSAVVMTREARLGLNGPEVIESEAGAAEFDAADRPLIWSIDGGVQRHALQQAEVLAVDDTAAIRAAVADLVAGGVRGDPASRDLMTLRHRLAAIDPADPPAPPDLPSLFAAGSEAPTGPTISTLAPTGRGRTWTAALATGTPVLAAASVLLAEIRVGDATGALLTVVADPTSPFRRARHGEVGLLESLTLAERVTAIVDADRALPAAAKRPIVAVVDLPSQAYGRLEEMVGLHLHLAAAADAYATARTAGHPIVALVVGTALSGGFLAHGLQADEILALDDPGVEIHAMHKPAAARITRRTVAELDALAARIPPLSYDVRDWATLGLCSALIGVEDADAPTTADLATVREQLSAAVDRARAGDRTLARRWSEAASGQNRAATRRVRTAMAEQWS